MALCGSSNVETPSTDEVTPSDSVGLKFELSSDEGSYYVSNLGTCRDNDVVIPSSYNGLPVIGIGDSAFILYSSLTSINYAGTMEQWNNIYNTNQEIQLGVVVTCTDGTITIE